MGLLIAFPVLIFALDANHSGEGRICMKPKTRPSFTLSLTLRRVIMCAASFNACGMPLLASDNLTPPPTKQHDSSTRTSPRYRRTGQIVHGTINIVLANGNGIVALTDSMKTETGPDGRLHQSLLPNRKLFVIDDSTVCTIAGFASQGFEPFSGATRDIESIIYYFGRQLRDKPKVPLRSKLIALNILIMTHLTTLAASTSIVLGPDAVGARDYSFELIMAGYDPDGSAQVGTFSLRASQRTSESGVPYYDIEQHSIGIETVDTTLKYFIGGQRDTALASLIWPQPFLQPALARYQQSEDEDKGASLTTEEMKELAIVLAARTAMRSRSVGGENQIAVLQRSVPLSLTQRPFPEPDGNVRPIMVLVDVEFGEGLGNAVVSDTPVMFIATAFKDTRQDIDRNYFVGNVFTSCVLQYGGGGFLGLGETNKVIDSTLVIRRIADPHSAQVQQLLHNFQWKAVIYEEPPTR